MEKYNRQEASREAQNEVSDFNTKDSLRLKSNSLEQKEINLEILKKVAHVAESTGEWLITINGICFQIAPEAIVERHSGGRTESLAFGVNSKYVKPFVNKDGTWGGVQEGWINTETGEPVDYEVVLSQTEIEGAE